jgi:hypothetical protein
MHVEQLWPTPVGRTDILLPEEVRQSLIAVLERKDASHERVRGDAEAFRSFVASKKFYHGIHYNLFAEAPEHPEHNSLVEFERIACRTFRDYLREAFAVEDADTVRLNGRCFGHVQKPGERTFPHYHQGCDGVLIHYLDVGEATAVNRPADSSPHALLLLDPRGSPNYPWWGKMHSIIPYRGLTILHPAYAWHETTVWQQSTRRVVIVVNFQVIGHGHASLYRELAF